MKNKLLFIFALINLNAFTLSAQFLLNTSWADRFGETDNANSVTSIGVGFYNTTDYPKAALEIKVPYLQSHILGWKGGTNPLTPPTTQGEALHSIVTTDWDHAWRMYTYNQGQDDQEKFNIINYANSSSVQLDVVQKGELELLTSERFSISG